MIRFLQNHMTSNYLESQTKRHNNKHLNLKSQVEIRVQKKNCQRDKALNNLL